MAVKYFEYFPTATFNRIAVTDITKRVNLKNTILSDPFAFMPYTIKEGFRPEDIAFFYYGDVKYIWLVYFSIAAIDPYFDWPLQQRELEKFIIKKYKAQSGETSDTDILAWTKNTLITENIVHYRNVAGGETLISKDTITLDADIEPLEWEAIRYYDYEVDLNENKRVIELLDASYAAQAENELKELLKNG